MSLFSKFFKTSNTKPSSKEIRINEQPVILSLDDLFVNNFINKGGKFLYCIHQQEALQTLKNILRENEWNQVSCVENKLKEICTLTNIPIASQPTTQPFLTHCEHLVADSGNIMMSSNQIGEMKLNQLHNYFIVFATTSQIVKNMGEGLTGIKSNYKGNIPTNICDIRKYNLEKTKDTFLNYGVSNAKNLYLILIEDL